MNYLNIDSFENRLNAWFRKKQDSVFVIEGPSQIGKTTFIQNYVRRHAVPNLYIDVKKHKDFLSNLLDDVNSVNDFFTTLCFVLNKPFVSSHTLIIFDGVEYCPKLRLFYKRFIEYENVNIVAISCGASGPLHYRDRLIPSSETVEYYKPLNFYEFLIAIGQKLIAEHLRSSIINKLPISQYLSSNLYRFYKIYNLVGGYPSSIQMYLTENDLTRCIKNNSLILEKQFEHAADLLDTEGRSLLFAIRDNLLSLITKKKYSSFDNYSAYRTKQIIQFLEEEHIFNIPTDLDIGDFSKLSSGKRIYLSHQCF